jgi:polyisoprenyl-phosphate glycosyltransferase
VITMDGDLQHPPGLIPAMVRAWSEEGYLVVEGVKVERGREEPAARRSAGLFYWILERLSGFDLRGASDFKLLDRRALAAWMEMGERSVFFRGMSAWIGFRRKPIPFAVEPRAGGRSRWSTGSLLRLALNGLTAFSSLPLHVITWMGAGFLCFAVLLGAYAIVKWSLGGAVTGFTTVIVLQLFTGSMLMIGLGILGVYVSRIYDEVKGRPRYVVAEELGPRTPEEEVAARA